MSYIRSVLQPNEKVIIIGRLHWIIYRHAILFAVAGIVLFACAQSFGAPPVMVTGTAVLFAGLFLLSFIHAWFIRWITEFGVTDRRVIYKCGFISRHTVEMNLDKVESVDVDQSILGRMIGYGTIHVRGTGVGLEHLHGIAQPLTLRSAITAK